MAFVKLISATIFSELLPSKGTKARVSVRLSTNASLWPFLHTQSKTHAVFLGVKEENILTLKLKLTLFFVGLSTHHSLWPFLHTQSQTHAVLLGVSLSTHDSLWPFLHMLQRRTGSLTDSFSKKTC